jgi:hypothetical protein
VRGRWEGKTLGQRRAKKPKSLGREDVFLVHPKMASTASSSTGALVAADSLQPSFPDFTANFNVSTFYMKTPTIVVGVNTNNGHWVQGRSWKWTLDLSIVSIIKRDP